MNGKNRSYVLGVAGGYLLYLDYQLYENRNNPEAGMSSAVRILFMILFLLAGIGLMVFAFRLWFKADREEREGKAKEEKKPENPNALK